MTEGPQGASVRPHDDLVRAIQDLEDENAALTLRNYELRELLRGIVSLAALGNERPVERD